MHKNHRAKVLEIDVMLLWTQIESNTVNEKQDNKWGKERKKQNGLCQTKKMIRKKAFKCKKLKRGLCVLKSNEITMRFQLTRTLRGIQVF